MAPRDLVVSEGNVGNPDRLLEVLHVILQGVVTGISRLPPIFTNHNDLSGKRDFRTYQIFSDKAEISGQNARGGRSCGGIRRRRSVASARRAGQKGRGGMDDIVAGAAGGIPAGLGQEADAARGYAAASRAASTRLIYDADWQRFQTWCAARGVPPLPADPVVVARFCACEAEARRASSTITRRLAAIGWAHKLAGLKPPQHADGGGAIAEVMAGIRRSRAAPPAQKAAADADVLRDMLRACTGEKLRTVRARALLAIGFAGAFRRSELVALRVEDLRRDAEGIRVVIRRSKADQEGEGAMASHYDKVLMAATRFAILSRVGRRAPLLWFSGSVNRTRTAAHRMMLAFLTPRLSRRYLREVKKA